MSTSGLQRTLSNKIMKTCFQQAYLNPGYTISYFKKLVAYCIIILCY